jgi:hypothetical protein
MIMTLDQPVADDEATLTAFHDERLRYLLSLSDEAERGKAATAYITWLDECRVDATAIRDVAVYKLHNDSGLGASRIGQHFGVGKARAQQLIYRSAQTYVAAAQSLAKIKRRLGRS